MKTSHIVCVTAVLSYLAPGIAPGDDLDGQHRELGGVVAGPLVQRVRAATARFNDVQLALAEGYAPGPCVSGAAGGAMGIHYINAAFLDDQAPSLENPEALIYEPLAGGRLQLVGVEYITLAGPAVLEGHLFHYNGAGNRYGLPEFWELHVWAWKRNPLGTFADWNPRVSCDFMAGS